MPYSEALDSRIIRALSGWGAARKMMFGGTCHFIRGNMMCGVYKDSLVLRLGDEEAGRALKEPHTAPFDVTGKPMKGWVMVEKDGLEGQHLERWLEKAIIFVESLPSKQA
jgi:TfoX/Sxy family transcriptional regulator of competence genes